MEIPDTIKLFPYQLDWIQDESKFAISEKSRRTGFTWCEAIASVLYCLRTGQNCWFSSSDEKNSKEFIIYVKDCCDVINAALGYAYIDLTEATTEVVRLPNGARISSISSSPKAFRGKDGRVVLDEFAFHEQQDEIYRAAHGSIITKGVLRIISTHNGPGTLFHQLCTGSPENGFTKHRVTLEDACEQGFAVKFATDLHHLLPDVKALNREFIARIKATCSSEDAYKQEFGCEPLSLQSLITPAEYDALALWDVPSELDPHENYNNLHVGIDVGRVHDLTVIWIIEEYINPKSKGEWDRYDYKTVCVKWIKNTPINTQYEIIKPLLGHPAVSSVVIDQGGIGRTLSDLIVDDFPFATPINFTNPRKAEMAERVKGFVTYQRISLPKTELIRDDLLAMQRQATSKGFVTYNGSTKETHCDFFWGAALALTAAVTQGGIVVVGHQEQAKSQSNMEQVLAPAA